jgi:hypothetical protein
MFKLIAVGATFAILAASTAAASAHGKTQTLRFFDKETSTTLTTPDGTVVDKPPYPEPQPGALLDVYSVEFVGNHRHHAKRSTASNHLHCVFGTGEPDCVSHTAIGGSLLIFSGNPGRVVAGTGRYADATGAVVKNKEVKGGSDVVVRIHVHGRRSAAAAEKRRVDAIAALSPKVLAAAFGNGNP